MYSYNTHVNLCPFRSEIIFSSLRKEIILTKDIHWVFRGLKLWAWPQRNRLRIPQGRRRNWGIRHFWKGTKHLASEWNLNNMEKRKFTRFLVQDDAFAALRGNFSKVGKIYDISLNGLAFRYLAEKMSNETFTHVDIFLSNNGFHLSDVSCTVVYDERESISNSNVVSPYRCGLKFGPLNEEQQNKLDLFLNNHTTEVLS